jgi:hypothetical protein
MWCQARQVIRGKNVFWGKVGKGMINLNIYHRLAIHPHRWRLKQL